MSNDKTKWNTLNITYKGTSYTIPGTDDALPTAKNDGERIDLGLESIIHSLDVDQPHVSHEDLVMFTKLKLVAILQGYHVGSVPPA